MFDPHGTRRNRRRISRKGQIIQAKAIDPPVTIDPRLVPIYRDYLTANNIISYIPPDPPDPPEPDWSTECPARGFLDPYKIRFDQTFNTNESHVSLPGDLSYTFVKFIDDNTARIIQIHNNNRPGYPINITSVDAYSVADKLTIKGTHIFFNLSDVTIAEDVDIDTDFNLFWPYIDVSIDLILRSD